MLLAGDAIGETPLSALPEGGAVDPGPAFDAVLLARQGRRPILQAYVEGLPDVICTEVPAGGDAKVAGYCLGPFDGTNDYAATANITDLAPSGDITVVCWFKLGSHVGIVYQTLWSWYASSKGWYCYVSDGDGKIHLVTKTSDVVGPSVVVDTQYCLVVSQGGTYGCETRFTLFAFDSTGALTSTTRSYKSGVTGGGAGPVRSTRDADSAAVTAAFEIGRLNGGSNYFSGGRIGYTAVYTRAFTQSEAERIVYRILDAKWTGFWSDLKIQVAMDEGTGTTLKNSSSSGGAYNMTINGGVSWDTSSTNRPWTITYRPYMTAISAVGQDLEARATRTTISTISFQVLDPGAASGWWLTAYLKRVAQAVRRKSCYIFMGFDEILEEDYELIMNGALEAIDPLKQRGYEVRVGDAIRFAKTSLLLGKTRLATSCTSVATTIEIDSLFNFRGRTSASATTGTQPIAGYVRIDDEIIYYESVQSSPVALLLCVRGRWGTTAAAHTAGATVTEIHHETATDPITFALMLLISNTGDYMTHATYDAYTRFTADDGSTFDGRGAGMSLADVDVAAIEAVRTAYFSTYVGEFMILDSIDNLKDWIEEQLLRPIGAFFLTQSDGTLSIGTWHTPSATGVATLEQGDQSQPEPAVDFSRVINSIELRCDLNPITGEYGKILIYEDLDSARDHGPAAPMRIDSSWIRTTRLQSGATITPSPSTLGTTLKNLLFGRFADPQAIVTAPAGLRWWSKEVGGGLKYQHEEIPDFVDGERGVMGALTQIVGRTLDPKRARVVLKLMRTP